MATIFKNSLIKEKLQNYEVPDFEEKIETLKRWHNDYYKGTLKQDKETSREQAYNQDVFVKILGYSEKPQTPYSLEPKATTDTGQLPDVILGSFNGDSNVLSAVVELKAASIPLDKPQRREGNMSPIQQAFKYKTQYPKCPFVVASNFYELRLFQDNQLDYEKWTLDDLVSDKNDYYEFKKFYFLLNKENFTSSSGNSATQNLLSDIRIEQEEITNQFYEEYRELRLELLRNIYQKNKTVRENIDLGIEKAQKIIDRIVFVCFCEDSGLLPDNSLPRVLQYSENSYGSLWNTLKGFFESIDKGSEKLEIPNGYNGGLFRNDEELNNLIIDDVVLKNLAKISKYNFSEDLSVTILGHIFEQSISDLEEIKEKVNDANSIEQIEKVSKRKKDGIFYTPDYVVDEIVNNSLGKYLFDKEEELKQKHRLKEDILDSNYEKREKAAYQEYQVFLENIKVLDPACGSGAFLVKVFDYLLEQNKRVGTILGGGLFDNEKMYKQILKSNIYGVDVNNESVEITRLSLWLKTAQKNKKLTSLDENIRCGNSLIDDQKVVGEKAFQWESEFKEIFDKGGFDVVVGNPPWVTVRQKELSEEEFAYLKQQYLGTEGFKLNLFPLFVEKSVKDLVKEDGYVSMIVPNRLLDTPSYMDVRKYILSNTTIDNIQNVPSGIFQGVVAGNIILTIRNQKTSKETVDVYDFVTKKLSLQIPLESVFEHKVFQININTNPLALPIIGKITKSDHKELKEHCHIHVGMMIKEKKEKFSLEPIHPEKIVIGRDFEKFAIRQFHYFNPDEVEIFGGTKNKEKHRTSPKLFVRKTGDSIVCAFDNSATYAEQSVYLVLPKEEKVNLKYILAVLNSHLTTFYFRNELITNPDSYPYVQHYDLEQIPIPSTDLDTEHKLSDLAESIVDLKEKQISYELLLKSSKEANDYDKEAEIQKKVDELKVAVVRNEEELNNIVYGLFDLSQDEIGIVKSYL